MNYSERQLGTTRHLTEKETGAVKKREKERLSKGEQLDKKSEDVLIPGKSYLDIKFPPTENEDS